MKKILGTRTRTRTRKSGLGLDGLDGLAVGVTKVAIFYRKSIAIRQIMRP